MPPSPLFFAAPRPRLEIKHEIFSHLLKGRNVQVCHHDGGIFIIKYLWKTAILRVNRTIGQQARDYLYAAANSFVSVETCEDELELTASLYYRVKPADWNKYIALYLDPNTPKDAKSNASNHLRKMDHVGRVEETDNSRPAPSPCADYIERGEDCKVQALPIRDGDISVVCSRCKRNGLKCRAGVSPTNAPIVIDSSARSSPRLSSLRPFSPRPSTPRPSSPSPSAIFPDLAPEVSRQRSFPQRLAAIEAAITEMADAMQMDIDETRQIRADLRKMDARVGQLEKFFSE